MKERKREREERVEKVRQGVRRENRTKVLMPLLLLVLQSLSLARAAIESSFVVS